jgi:restriction system protein
MNAVVALLVIGAAIVFLCFAGMAVAIEKAMEAWNAFKREIAEWRTKRNEEKIDRYRQHHPTQILGVPDIKGLRRIDRLLSTYISTANAYRPKFIAPDPRFRSITFSYPFDVLFPRSGTTAEDGPEPNAWEVTLDDLAINPGNELASIYGGLKDTAVFPAAMGDIRFDRPTPPSPIPSEWETLDLRNPDLIIVSATDGSAIDLSSAFLRRVYQPVIAQAETIKTTAIKLMEQIDIKIDDAIEAKELLDIHVANEELRFRQAAQALAAEYSECCKRYAREAKVALAPVEAAHKGLLSGAEDGVREHFEFALRALALPLPDAYPWRAYYKQDERVLQVNQRVPAIRDLVVKRTDSKRAPAKRDVEFLLHRYYPAISLHIAAHVARNDFKNNVDAIAVNCWSRFFEKATGKLKNAFVSSFSVTKQEILNIDINKADALEAFRAMKGAFVYDAKEVVPIEPSIRLDKNDERFVEGREILEGMAQGQNLATMDWQEFEHLIRELLAKEYGTEGTDVRITRASRDRGVDAVIFDPDALRGGKFIVQAKRYNNLVDVSAVRDLYGTMMNEGAARGILVTTSRYGRDAHEFASNKPITLLDGQHLLSMLAKHGYKFKIELV